MINNVDDGTVAFDALKQPCRKCGYQRTVQDTSPETECPKCGAIYTKVEARFETEKIEKEKKAFTELLKNGTKYKIKSGSFNPGKKAVFTADGIYVSNEFYKKPTIVNYNATSTPDTKEFKASVALLGILFIAPIIGLMVSLVFSFIPGFILGVIISIAGAFNTKNNPNEHTFTLENGKTLTIESNDDLSDYISTNLPTR